MTKYSVSLIFLLTSLFVGIFSVPAWSQVSACAFAMEAHSQEDSIAARLQKVVDQKRAITFQSAVQIVADILGPANSKSFVEKSHKNIFSAPVTIWNKKYNPIWGRTSRLKERGIVGSLFLPDSLVWRSKVPKTSSELLAVLFDSIQIVYQSDLPNLNALSIYYRSRSTIKANVIDVARQVLEHEYALSDSGSLLEPSPSPGIQKLKIIYDWFRYLTFSPSPATPWIYRWAELDQNLANDIRSGDKQRVEQNLSQRLSPAVSVQYFMSHLRNLRRAVFASLALILGPEIWSAADYQWNIENFGLNSLTETQVSSATAYMQSNPDQISIHLRTQLNNSASVSMSPEERDFISEVQRALDDRPITNRTP